MTAVTQTDLLEQAPIQPNEPEPIAELEAQMRTLRGE
jgi:hypothetical protein